MIPFILRKRLKKGMILLFFAVWLVAGGGVVWAAAWAEGASPRQATPSEVPFLQDQLKQTLQEEAALRRQIKMETRLAVRPYTEYLLYQKSLRFSDHAARLEELKQERMEVIQKLTDLQEETGLPADVLQKVGERSRESFPTYSGAPLLSFYDAALVDPVSRSPSYSPFWTNFLRLSFSMVLLLIIVLPVVALRKLRSDLRHQEIIRVFPIFTVRRPKGSGRLELLQMVVKRGA
ncbi:MAG: hypothetical protein WAO55_01070 [Candidatus Manganitrophaceae bacterium]